MEDQNLTNEEKQELTALREEKRIRQQTQRAEAALTSAEIPQGFAALLAGQNDADTDARVKAFCQTYQQTLSQDIRSRLPVTDTPVLHAPAPTRPKRGIVRVR